MTIVIWIRVHPYKATHFSTCPFICMCLYTVYQSFIVLLLANILSFTDQLYTVASNNRSRRQETLLLQKYLRRQHMRKLTRLSLMLSTVTSKRLRESTIFTPMSHLLSLRTNTKTLALLYIPNYNVGTDVHAVAPSGDSWCSSREALTLSGFI